MSETASPEFARLHSPLYRVIEQNLRKRVEDREWAPGVMLPNRKLLANEYGVDTRTIQRAIKDLVNDGTLYAQTGSGTFVPRSPDDENHDANEIVYKTIAIIAEQSFSPVPSWSALVSAMHQEIRRNTKTCRIITINTSDKSTEGLIRQEQNALKMVKTEDLAGVFMFHSGGKATLPDIRHVLNAKTPMVLIDRLPIEQGCDFVGIDNYLASKEAVEYLISIGHRRIAFVAPDEDVSTIIDRMNGYFSAFVGAGLNTPNDLVFSLCAARCLCQKGLKTELSLALDEMSSMPDPPTAIFAVNDFLAEYLMILLEERGVRVPADMSIVGFDDIERFLPQKPRLTTVRQPFEAIGERAAAMLWWRMEHPDCNGGTYQHVMLPTRLVVRDSTRPI